MDYARWQAQVGEAVGDGSTARDHWEVAARRGNPLAIARLTAPPMPDTVAYMWDWLMELHGRSGASMAGLLPLNYTTIDAWARMTGTDIHPLEVRALIALDGVLLSAEPEPEAEPAPRNDAWPERKNG